MKDTYKLLKEVRISLTENNLSNAKCEEVLVSLLEGHLCFGASFSVDRGYNEDGEFCSELFSVNYFIPVETTLQFSNMKLVYEVVQGLIEALEEEQLEFIEYNEVH